MQPETQMPTPGQESPQSTVPEQPQLPPQPSEEPAPLAEELAPAPTDQAPLPEHGQDKHPVTQVSSSNHHVTVAIIATVIIVIVLAVLAVYAYSKK